MRTRTLAREAALQYLYEVDMVGPEEAEDLGAFLVRQLGRAEARPFARALVEGVLAHRDEIDRLLVELAENWTLERMAAVDRNVLRLGAYEIAFATDPPQGGAPPGGGDVPPKVAMNEAIDLARRFSSEEACAFVNGILDRVADRSPGDAGGETEKRKGD